MLNVIDEAIKCVERSCNENLEEVLSKEEYEKWRQKKTEEKMQLWRAVLEYVVLYCPSETTKKYFKVNFFNISELTALVGGD